MILLLCDLIVSPALIYGVALCHRVVLPCHGTLALLFVYTDCFHAGRLAGGFVDDFGDEGGIGM